MAQFYFSNKYTSFCKLSDTKKAELSDWVQSTGQSSSNQREPLGSPAAIHGPIIYPQYSSSFRTPRLNQSDCPDPSPTPPMRGTGLGPDPRWTAVGGGLDPTPQKKHRRFFRFRSNTTSSRGTLSSREQINSEPLVSFRYYTSPAFYFIQLIFNSLRSWDGLRNS